MLLDLSASTRLLVLAPHPDDETIATGGLIQQVLTAGGTVRIVHLTDGDNNPWPQRWLERRLRIDARARQRWGRLRRGEAGLALSQLGLTDAALHAMHWPDGEIAARLCTESSAMMNALRAELDDYGPDLVVAPSLGDRHPDHGSAHVLLRLALATYQAKPKVLAYLVHGRAAPDTAWLEVPMSAAQQANKLAALACYHTQMALSGGRMQGLTARPERYEWVDITALTPASEVLPWQPSAWLRPWLRLMVADATGVRQWRFSKAPLHWGEGRGYRLQMPEAPGPRFVRLHLDLPSPWIFDHWGWRRL
jgi:LmbE family N-acetylglucosaminyl deacetylase